MSEGVFVVTMPSGLEVEAILELNGADCVACTGKAVTATIPAYGQLESASINTFCVTCLERVVEGLSEGDR